ncbi:MAG: gliding motility-associated C-terminal domain-containing protein [Bacteroidota bacterium]
MFLLLSTLPTMARHVAGGELYYEYLGSGSSPNTSNYRITLRLFRECSSPGPLLENERVNVGIYDNSVLVSELQLLMQGSVNKLRLKTELFQCLVGNPEVCYEVAIYTNIISLVNNQNGYVLSRLGCCRIDRISNLATPLSVGSNYITRIPGTASLPEEQHNNSPQFRVRDTALVCTNKKFVLDFGATDIDKDVLTYSFCEGFTAASGSNNTAVPRTLSLDPLSYAAPFNGSQPLGDKVTIDPITGIISGTAPPGGQYVVSVCITEWRNGIAIAEHRKDFILKVDDCDLIEADLPDKIIKCDNNTVLFENGSTSSAITSYAWEFGVPSSPNNFSTQATPTFVYADTGKYKVTLTVTGPEGCIGTDSTVILVYPGFKTDFSSAGNCFQNPYLFTDATTTVYGIVNKWKWNFGVDTSLADTSLLKNPLYKYTKGMSVFVSLVSESSKGCIDSARKAITIRDKPLIGLPFKDTVICSVDSLLIPVSGAGIFNWLPNYNILAANTSSPTVFPKDTTKYIVTMLENGCANTDTVTVNVVDFITVQLGPDTTICQTDIITLRPNTIASTFAWSPAASLNNPSVRNPLARPLTNTTYTIIGNLGSCQATDQITIRVAPYPRVNILTNDTVICYGSRVQLNGSFTGTHYRWSPTTSLFNATSLNPLAGPSQNTLYTLSVRDTLSGCPKTVVDSIRITVIPLIQVDAGRDTMIVPDQPLQLQAIVSSGNQYRWSPGLGLSNTIILNPVVQLGDDVDSIIYRLRVSNLGGCYGEDAIKVRVYKGKPDILVPSAFTPNADGTNDIFKPITIGITQLQYFRIYNRWGQLLYTTSEQGAGWDGSYQGLKQVSGTYVYMIQGTDFAGKTVFRKGTVVLIR